jgi:hypothetical protein
MPRRGPILACTAFLAILVYSPAADAAQRELSLELSSLELPGAPATVVSADVDGDGLRDLAVVIAFTRWGEVGIEESVEMDQVRGLVEVMTVIPALVDHRELWVFLGRAEGGFEPTARSMTIDASVLSLEAGPAGAPVIALTDRGLSALRLRGDQIALEPLVDDPPLLAKTATFLPSLGLVHDLDGDGQGDVLLPTADGASVYLAAPGGLHPTASSRLRFPLRDLQRRAGSALSRFHPLPEVEDVDGDALPDLVLRHADGGWDGFQVLRNLGKGRFAPPIAPLGPVPDVESVGQWKVVHFGDLDGDGRAEYVTQEEIEDEEGGLRREMRQVKRPQLHLRVHRATSTLRMEDQPIQEIELEGYAFDFMDDGLDDEEDDSIGFSIRMPAGGSLDLNGDGRRDVVALTLDFSLFQALKVLTVRRIGIGLDFHVLCQEADGRFRPVNGLDLSGKLQVDLDDVAIRHVSQFSGDFDGDGRIDFTQMGRGRTVTVHRGRADCSYPARPDLSVELREEPRDLALVQIRDLDGDDLSDLLLIQPQAVKETSVTPTVRLDLYLSRGAS